MEYEYVAVEDDELTIHRGDVISNVVVLSDGWMEGDLDGRRGAFPDNFVKVRHGVASTSMLSKIYI